jgi:hypothetical protein
MSERVVKLASDSQTLGGRAAPNIVLPLTLLALCPLASCGSQLSPRADRVADRE